MKTYLENFSSKEDVINSYSAPEDALKDAEIIIAWYGYGDYCGSSLVVFECGGKLYEVNGSHCSCFGLEGQWEPEETSWEALNMRNLCGYDGAEQAQDELQRIVKERMAAKEQP